MKKMMITGYHWDSNSEISFSPIYENWYNQYGNRDLMEVEIIDHRNEDSINIALSIDDMIELQEFLENRIVEARLSGFYEELQPNK